MNCGQSAIHCPRSTIHCGQSAIHCTSTAIHCPRTAIHCTSSAIHASGRTTRGGRCLVNETVWAVRRRPGAVRHIDRLAREHGAASISPGRPSMCRKGDTFDGYRYTAASVECIGSQPPSAGKAIAAVGRWSRRWPPSGRRSRRSCVVCRDGYERLRGTNDRRSGCPRQRRTSRNCRRGCEVALGLHIELTAHGSEAGPANDELPPRTYANTSGATIEASGSMMCFGVV